MKVKRVGEMVLEDPLTRYYELKKLGQCPKCNAGMQFSTEHRVLRAACTSTCSNTMTMQIPRVLTFDRKLEMDKAALDQLIEDVLVAKFDFLFQHSSENLSAELKAAYVEARQDYNDTKSALINKTREPDVRADLQVLKESSGQPTKRKEWCHRYKRFRATELRVQTLKYKNAASPLEMLPYTWAELEVPEINIAP